MRRGAAGDRPLTVVAEPLTASVFAPFGDVLEAAGAPDRMINRGACGRWHDLARLDIADGRAGISLFRAKAQGLPLRLEMMERHPLGSQAFLPMGLDPYLVVVARDEGGHPGSPRAFVTRPGQGVNYHRGVWHGVLTPLCEPGLFVVVDRIGDGANLEEHWFEEPPCVGNDADRAPIGNDPVR